MTIWDDSVRVTREVTPHHFTLTDTALASYDTNCKMNPPLREEADRDALLQGLVDGSIDVIATDHAPHHYDEKRAAFDSAPFGVVGLETAVSIALDRLVNAGLLSLSRLVELFSVNPARILNVPGGTLAPGRAADITVLAPDLAVTVQAHRFRSKGRNTPFDGWQLRGVGSCLDCVQMVPNIYPEQVKRDNGVFIHSPQVRVLFDLCYKTHWTFL